MLRQSRRLFKFSTIKDKIKKEKLERLQKESIYFPTITTDKSELLRNFGIIAHIDAGKTTTTERMLYYAGVLNQPGEVHDGNTVMDYLPQERERGITIRSAAISFNWDCKFQIYNLIDTPGHIDFTAEVERSLRVLDGAVAIFDGVSGVETQSETVWFQANRFNIPRIAFVNKMDRQGASLELTLSSMKERLNIQPLILQYPVGEAEQFQSIIDLIDMQEIVWNDKLGNLVEFRQLETNHPLYEKAQQFRDMLLETISMFDDSFASQYLDGKQFNKDQIIQSIRKVLNLNPLRTCPVLLGSALKNRGVQPLMDAVQQFLPFPAERPLIHDYQNKENKRQLASSEKLCAYTYKVIHDNELGNLAYARIYSGVLESKQQVLNSTQDQPEKLQHIYRVRANKYVSIQNASAGDIVALQGLKNCSSGITLISPTDPKFVLSQINLPQCVFFASLEYESMKDKSKLDSALATLAKEDNSLKITEDEGGQIVIGGLGELHLEIVSQRLKEEWNLNTKLRRMQVEYKESIQESVTQSMTWKDLINKRPLWFNLRIKLEPLDREKDQSNQIIFDFPKDNQFDIYYKEFKLRQQVQKVKNHKPTEELNRDLEGIKFLRNPMQQAEQGTLSDAYGEEKVFSIQSLSFPLLYELEQQLNAALTRGPLRTYQLMSVRASILGGQYTNNRTNEIAIGRCVQELIKNTLQQGNPVILEPVMHLEISSPNSVVQTIINDLISVRRGHMDVLSEDQSRFGKVISDRSLIKGTIPLQETIGYSTFIRSISQGEAYFSISFKSYDQVGATKQNQLMQGEF